MQSQSCRPDAALPAVYELEGQGRDGNLKHFEKPWAMTTVMFLGMSFCLPLAFFLERRKGQRPHKAAGADGGAAEPLLSDEVRWNRCKHTLVQVTPCP